MKKVLDLLIHLEDHKHDGLGRLFLDPGDEREVRRSLREYLGARRQLGIWWQRLGTGG